MNILSKNLVFLRKFKNLYQSEIADSTGFKRTTYNNYERGVSEPSLNDLLKISKYFGLTLDEIVTIDLEANAHLIKKIDEDEKQENAHLNAHPNAHLNPEKRSKEHYLKARETILNQALNEPGGPSDNTKDQITELYNKINALEQIITNKLASIEEDISKLKTKK